MEKLFSELLSKGVAGRIAINSHFGLFDPETAQQITSLGKEYIRKMQTMINDNRIDELIQLRSDGLINERQTEELINLLLQFRNEMLLTAKHVPVQTFKKKELITVSCKVWDQIAETHLKEQGYHKIYAPHGYVNGTNYVSWAEIDGKKVCWLHSNQQKSVDFKHFEI